MTTDTHPNFINNPYEKFMQQLTGTSDLPASPQESQLWHRFSRGQQYLITKGRHLFYGAVQGFALGSLGGLGIGIISALQSRIFLYIPFSMCSSGLLFSGFMACGNLVLDTEHSHTPHTSGGTEPDKESRIAAYIQQHDSKQASKENQLI